MLSKITLVATVVTAQFEGLDFGDFNLDDFDVASLYKNGDICVTGFSDTYCPTKCCAKNIVIDTKPFLGYDIFESMEIYTQQEVDEKVDNKAFIKN